MVPNFRTIGFNQSNTPMFNRQGNQAQEGRNPSFKDTTRRVGSGLPQKEPTVSFFKKDQDTTGTRVLNNVFFSNNIRAPKDNSD